MSDHDLEEEVKLVFAENAESAGKNDAAPGQIEEECLEKIKLLAGDADEEAAACGSQKIGPYRLLCEIGSGAAGTVYKARRDDLDADLVLKVISKELYRNELAAKRLLASLQRVSTVSNFHLASYYDCGVTENGAIYFVSDELKGRSLKELFESGELFYGNRFLELFKQICSGLKSLHENDLLHGDLKPSNIFILDVKGKGDFVKICDYGINSSFTEESRLDYMKLLSRTGQANYMSPEQCLSFGLDARSDIYSIGLLMYEALSGQPLARGESQIHSMLKQLNLRVRSLRESGFDISESLEKIIMKCLEKNRSSRYYSITDLEIDLELAASEIAYIPGLSEEPDRKNDSNATPAPSEKTRTKKRRRRRLIVAGLVGSFLLSSITFALLQRRDSTYFQHQAEMHLALANAYDRPVLPLSQAPANPALGPLVAGPTLAEPGNLNDIPDAQALGKDASILYPQVPLVPVLTRAQKRHFDRAEGSARRAIIAYKIENLFRRDRQYRHRLSSLQTLLGEIYLRDQFAEDGGRKSRSDWLNKNSEGVYGDLSSVRLYPAFPGLLAGLTLPDYKAAEVWFEKAARTLKKDYGVTDLDLLWDLAYTKFQLGKSQEAIEVHHRILRVMENQKLQDKNALLMTHRNIGLIYMLNGHYSQAVGELQDAIKVDEDLNKTPGKMTDELRVELAYALMRDGKFELAEQLAVENLTKLKADGAWSAPSWVLGGPYELNMQVLTESQRVQGKMIEKDPSESAGRTVFEG